MSEQPIHFRKTQYGFEWGAATVERICDHRGRVDMRIVTPKHPNGILIYVTKSGKVRVFNADAKGCERDGTPTVYREEWRANAK